MTVIDMGQFIAPKSDQINADDLIGGPRTITVARVNANEGSPEQPINVYFDGDNGKPFRPCKSMRRVMVAAWGSDASQYVGRSMTIYRDPKVQFGGMSVGGIRISHMSHIERDLTMALTATRAKRAPYTVKALSTDAAPQKDGALTWTERYIAGIDAAETLDALVAFENERAPRLEDLRGKRPELAERCQSAAQARAGALSREVRAEADHGEQFDGGEG